MAGYADARFLVSAARPEQFLPDAGAEVAFAGRSNSGKSTAINAILGRRQLARTSKTPGRTQLVNFFGLAPRHRVVDLPGYGYARVPPAVQAEWRALMEAYFTGRRCLAGVILVADSRRGLTDFDRQMIAWMAALERPVHVLMSKCDQLSRAEMTRLAAALPAELGADNTWQFFSGRTGEGLAPARERLQAMLRGEPRRTRH